MYSLRITGIDKKSCFRVHPNIQWMKYITMLIARYNRNKGIYATRDNSYSKYYTGKVYKELLRWGFEAQEKNNE